MMYEIIALLSFTGIFFFLGLALFRLFAGKKIINENAESGKNKVRKIKRITLFKRHLIFSFLSLIIFTYSVFKIIHS